MKPDPKAAVLAFERRLVDRVTRILQEIVDTDFDGNQTRTGKALGISQCQVSEILHKTTGKIGMRTLFALHLYTRRGLDDLCGLPSAPKMPATGARDGIVERLLRLEADVTALRSRSDTAPEDEERH